MRLSCVLAAPLLTLILLCASTRAEDLDSLQLGALPEVAGDSKAHVGGTGAKLDHLGPLVVTEDGQLRRITNWDQLSEREQEGVRRRVVKRNNERLAVLRNKAAAEDAGDSTLKTPEAAAKLEEPPSGEADPEDARKQALNKFTEALANFAAKGGSVPGFEEAQDLLKDPREKRGDTAVPPDFDLGKLRERLSQLKDYTEELKGFDFKRKDEL